MPLGDAELVAACRMGQPRAWENLVLRFERLVFMVPRRAGLTTDEAADVFQNVFLRLHQHLHLLEQPERVRAWLVTTARRATLDVLVERRRTVPLQPPPFDSEDGEAEWAEAADPGPLPDECLDELQQRHRVRAALASMAEPCRSLLGMLYGGEEPLPYAEIVARLGMPIGSIGPTRARCLARLRALLEGQP